jgi:hypothetical protein
MTRSRYYWLLFCLIVVGTALSALDLHTMPIRERMVHAFADALLIASLLAGTVDTYLKKWLLKEAALDVFQFMIGFQLPRGVTDRIKMLVQDAALIRRDCELRWTLTWEDDKKESVHVWLEATFSMENSSHVDKTYLHKTFGTNPNEPYAKVEAMWYHSSKIADDYNLEGDRLKVENEDDMGNRWINAEPRVIPSRNRERDLDCKFGAKYYSRNRAQDDDNYTFSHSTLNVRVVIEAPKDLKIKVDPKADRTHLGNSYEYSRLFVDNESITLRWSKQPAASDVES